MTRTYLSVLSMLFLAAVALTISCNGQKDNNTDAGPETIEIVLQVNTSDLPDSGEVDLSDYSYFDPADTTEIELYSRDVKKGDTVIWKGLGNGNHRIYITDIVYESGVDILEPESLPGDEGDVVRRVKNDDSVKSGDVMKYSIHFQVIINGNVVREGKIDPKLKVL